jgi:hypothetical protein
MSLLQYYYYYLFTVYNFKINMSINKNFVNTCMVLISNILIRDNTTIAAINYKEYYECECDPTILTNYIICTSIFKLL